MKLPAFAESSQRQRGICRESRERARATSAIASGNCDGRPCSHKDGKKMSRCLTEKTSGRSIGSVK